MTKEKLGAHGEMRKYDTKDGQYRPEDYNSMSTEDLSDSLKIDLSKKPKKKKQITKEEFFGNEIVVNDNENPIEVMLANKSGHIKNAFYKEGLGYIDLVWGNEDGGVCHLIKQRDKKYKEGIGSITGQEMAKLIPFIIKNGKLNEDDKGRLKIDYENLYRVGIAPCFHKEKVNWIVTAMEILK